VWAWDVCVCVCVCASQCPTLCHGEPRTFDRKSFAQDQYCWHCKAWPRPPILRRRWLLYRVFSLLITLSLVRPTCDSPVTNTILSFNHLFPPPRLPHSPTFTAAICPHAWGSILQKLSFPPHSLISQCANELLTTILGRVQSQPQACRNALSSLVSFGAGLFLPKVVEQVCALLGQQEVLEVTGEQLEVMRTPPGQLWHKGMVHE